MTGILISMMEHSKSIHVNNRAMAFLQDTQKKHTRNLKILKYISFLIDFYLYQQKARGKLPAISKIRHEFYGTGISAIILEEFYNKFAEKTTIDGAVTMNDNGQTKENEQ
jgi:DNA-directed RNA polymerase I subunit RPA49